MSNEVLKGASEGITVHYRLSSDEVDKVIPGEVMVPGSVFEGIAETMEGEMRISTTTRRIVVNSDSAIYKLKPMKACIPSIPKTAPLFAASGKELVKVLKGVLFGNQVGIYLEPGGSFLKAVDPFMSAEISLSADCDTKARLALPVRQLLRLMPLLRTSDSELITIGANDRATVFTSEKWDASIQNVCSILEGVPLPNDFPMFMIADVSDLTYIFTIAVICGGHCEVYTEDGRLHMKSDSETLSGSCSIPVIEGSLPTFKINPVHMLHALKACALWENTVYVGTDLNRLKVANETCKFGIAVLRSA